MEKGKRLLVVLMAALVMILGAVGMTYAETSDYYIWGLKPNDEHTEATVLSNHKTEGQFDTIATCSLGFAPGVTGTYDGTEKTVEVKMSTTTGYDSYTTDNLSYSFEKKGADAGDVGRVEPRYDIIYEGTTASGNEYDSTTAPKEAGTYTARVILDAYVPNQSGRLPDARSAEVKLKFTIEPKTIDVEWIGSDGFVYEYDGENHVPDAKITEGLAQGDKVSVNVTGAAKTVATHTATAKLVGPDAANYVISDDTKTKKFTIDPRTVTVKWLGVNDSETDFDFIYNGQEQGPTCVLSDGLVKGESCDVTVTGQKTEAGEYTATATLSNPCYVIEEGSETHAFKIAEYTIVKLFWDPESLEYNAAYQHPEATVSDSETGKPIDPLECGLTYTVYKNSVAEGNLVPEGTKMPVGTYVVAAALTNTEGNFKFAEGTEKNFTFTVTPKVVEVALDIEDPIYYDADYHKPEITATGIFDSDGCRPAVSLKGQTLKGEKVEIPDCNDSTLGPEKTGVIHASSGKYTAKVQELVGTDATNYELKARPQLKFQILPKEVTLDWFRPAYDEYGDEVEGSDGVLVDVAGGEKLKLVFNGKAQAPKAKIQKDMLLTNEVTGEKDKCTVTVSGPSYAIEARETPYKVTDISFSNPDYRREQSGADYYIIAHPVKLKWDTTETTYNGKEQKRTVEITNIQKTDRGKDYVAGEGIGVVKVSEITYTPGYHFGSDGMDTDESKSSFNGKTGYYTSDGVDETGMAEGSQIANDRIPTDAGTYVMTAAELSDPYNYTLVKINPDTVELDPAFIPHVFGAPAYVDNHHPIYTIHQYEITKIDWRNNPVTYNASWQKPIAEVNKSDLQGPDTNKQVVVMMTDDLKRIHEKDFLGFCNAGTHKVYVFKNEGDTPHRGIKGGDVDRSMNYFIGEDAQKMDVDFVINKKALTVTVYDKTGYYGDDPATYKHSVKYAGLINGNVNTDDNHQNTNIPGKYNPNAPFDGALKDVVDTSGLTFSTNYKLYGKPGKYSVSASGLKSDNYAIKYVNGVLTIKNRILSSELVAKAIAGNGTGKVYWQGVSGASKYQVYISYCDTDTKKYTPKLYKTVGAKTRNLTVKKLKKNTYYKFYVVALDKNGKRLAKTDCHHFVTNNVRGKWTNPKSIKASRAKVTVKNGKTAKLTASVSKVKANKTLTDGRHTQKLRYMSGNKKVATVTSKGVIKGVGTGWCRVYVMAANGIWQAVEVTVN